MKMNYLDTFKIGFDEHQKSFVIFAFRSDTGVEMNFKIPKLHILKMIFATDACLLDSTDFFIDESQSKVAYVCCGGARIWVMNNDTYSLMMKTLRYDIVPSIISVNFLLRENDVAPSIKIKDLYYFKPNLEVSSEYTVSIETYYSFIGNLGYIQSCDTLSCGGLAIRGDKFYFGNYSIPFKAELLQRFKTPLYMINEQDVEFNFPLDETKFSEFFND